MWTVWMLQQPSRAKLPISLTSPLFCWHLLASFHCRTSMVNTEKHLHTHYKSSTRTASIIAPLVSSYMGRTWGTDFRSKTFLTVSLHLYCFYDDWSVIGNKQLKLCRLSLDCLVQIQSYSIIHSKCHIPWSVQLLFIWKARGLKCTYYVT